MAKHDHIAEVKFRNSEMLNPDVRFLLANELTLLPCERAALPLAAIVELARLH